MEKLLFTHLKNLKATLLSLNPTGETGFEGLVKAMLREVSGVPFSLAGSGTQGGVDGKPAYKDDSICFEAKRYNGNISRGDLITKIADLVRDNSHPDLAWVLGATSPVRTQLAEDLRKDGRRNCVNVLILDWSENDIPPFAVALAMGGDRVVTFLKNNISDRTALKNALCALEHIRTDEDFDVHATRIRAELDVPAIGTSLAKEANAKWLTSVFSDKRNARIRLGQPLSPGSTTAAKLLPRESLSRNIRSFLTSAPDSPIAFVLGDEGCGKSWVVAQSWTSIDRKPLMVVLTADQFHEVALQNDTETLLIDKLIEQTGDDPTEVNNTRWQRRFAQWRRTPRPDNPRLVVVIDGINQRPKVDWGRIIDMVGGALEEIGGRLILTSRTEYFRDYVKNRLTAQTTEVLVPKWTCVERDEILRDRGVTPSTLHAAVADALSNPRLLGIALELLNNEAIAALKELSVSRLLFEHIRASEQDGISPQPASEFCRRLQDHAQEILDRIQNKQSDDLNIFEGDTPAVADSRFFHTVDGEPDKYELKDDGLESDSKLIA